MGALRRIASKLDAYGRATVYKAQIRSMDYICFVVRELSASTTTRQLLDRIHKKALWIIGLDSDEAFANFNLYHLLSTDVELQLPWSCTKCTQITAVHTLIGCPQPPTFQKPRMTLWLSSIYANLINWPRAYVAVKICGIACQKMLLVKLTTEAQSFNTRTHKQMT